MTIDGWHASLVARSHMKLGKKSPNQIRCTQHHASCDSLVASIVVVTSVADPDLSDPCVFGPPGSGSFYHQAKTLFPTVLWFLFLSFYLWKMMYMYLQKILSRIFLFIWILLASWRSMTKIAGAGSEYGSIRQRHGSRIRTHTKMTWIRNTGGNT